MPAIKVYTANLGFYEVAVAARSQKMALAHWGVKRDLRAIEAAMQKVGLVYRRPVRSGGRFEEREEAQQTLLKSWRPKRKAGKKKSNNRRAGKKRKP